MMIPTRTFKGFVVSALFVTALAIGLFSVGKEDEMPAKVMMNYGLWSPEDNRFDASRWFDSGMYRRRSIGTPPEVSADTMLRNKPLPITRDMNEDLVATAGVALEYDFPGVNTDSLISHPPQLNQRVRYWLSKFDKPDKPVDLYNLFLELEGQRFVITFSRDGQTGNLIDSNSARLISVDQQADAEYVQIFNELDEAERRRR
ncbi:hypothetical protein [Pseudomonas bananamidigenes]|uniref:hypothetical protein n=1 Tax=Pseudomonas bananamidigenes TaxID=2843610 RepID=UPI000802B94D|nr:hypothetical protein [Pseudomonas bananamidigenes]